ncbi:hypothetical protein MRX96_026385 [Rhipicephalus microplus]
MLICMDNSMPYSVTLLSSLGMLADAWNAVTSATIRNCFEHAFRIPGCSIATSSDCLQTEGDDESQVLSALKAHNIAADLDSYAATDDNLCVCREDTLDDLVAEVLPAQHSSESEEEPEVENVTTAQAFQYIAKELTRFMGMANYLMKFVPNMPKIAHPMNTLLNGERK